MSGDAQAKGDVEGYDLPVREWVLRWSGLSWRAVRWRVQFVRGEDWRKQPRRFVARVAAREF